ncbi:metalloendoproteinase 1-MMP-like [Papaver somniferum]|uniref:metalloendoproteinase 1-MMP-like n=1 Tax=Papaver somniferum TaxID=3469 RepID=UPI000E6FC1B5|nr:metalloendoproteinase 1-MMP-like [Papaver somniferum]
MQDDGNLVFYNSRSEIIWESFDYPTDTIPGGQNLRSGVDLNSFGKRLHSLNGENGLSVQDSNGLVSTSSLSVTNIPTTVRSPELHRIGHFSVFEGHPRWNKSTLTYSMSTNFIIDYINQNDILMVLQSSFGRWSSVVQLNFTETKAYDSADIKIGFYYGDHGDGLPFTRGTLAHAFEPEIGMLHFNADVVWSVDFKLERRKDAIDLESVATHEIGHLLGLNHSADPDAVMFWSIPRRTKKRDLTEDDVLGVRTLYRANLNYRLDHHASSVDNSPDEVRKEDHCDKIIDPAEYTLDNFFKNYYIAIMKSNVTKWVIRIRRVDGITEDEKIMQEVDWNSNSNRAARKSNDSSWINCPVILEGSFVSGKAADGADNPLPEDFPLYQP